MKELISKISVTTFLLFYLFFCGTLYLIAYWSTFDFDITNYIELLDIPKSFVYPLVTGIGVFYIIIFIQAFFRLEKSFAGDDERKPELQKNDKELSNEPKLVRLLTDYHTWTAITLFICAIFYQPTREWVLVLVCFTIIVFSITKLINHDVIIKYIPGSGIRLLFAILLIVVPVFSFLRGKLNAIEIWSNEKYFTIKRLTFADESITNNFISKKLLGKLGSNLFLSDSLNTTIIILNTDRIQAIEYELHKQKSLKKHKAEATQKKGQNSPLKSTTASGLYK